MKSISRIIIDFIPHANQRYPTAGDWYFEGSILHIRVSRTANERHQQLVSIHEISEALACNVDGVTQKSVDDYDTGPGKALDEPGNDPRAPYHAQHMLATAVERIMASALGVDWKEYEAEVGAL